MAKPTHESPSHPPSPPDHAGPKPKPEQPIVDDKPSGPPPHAGPPDHAGPKPKPEERGRADISVPQREDGLPPGAGQGADRGSDSGEEETPPDPGMQTVVQEQRRRAAEMERVGVGKWVEEHAGPRDDKPKQVQGVSPTEKR